MKKRNKKESKVSSCLVLFILTVGSAQANATRREGGKQGSLRRQEPPGSLRGWMRMKGLENCGLNACNTKTVHFTRGY